VTRAEVRMFTTGLFPQARIITLSSRRLEPHRVVVDGAEVGRGLSWDTCYGDMRRRYDRSATPQEAASA
jgi:hypothetical protein